MNIPEELFQEITQSITVVGQDESESGERQSPRMQLCTHVALLPWANPAVVASVRIRDISKGGIGILHSRQMPLDTQFVVRLPRNGEQHVLPLYTVVYWEPLAENLIAIGARFERILEAAELSARQVEMSQTSPGILARITHALARVRRIAS